MTSAEPVVARPSSVVGEAMPRTRRLILVVPLIGFLGLALALAWGMSRNPTAIPSALIGKAVPQFSLPPVKGRTLGLSERRPQRPSLAHKCFCLVVRRMPRGTPGIDANESR